MTDEERQRRLNQLLGTIVREATEDGAALIWSLDIEDGEGVARTQPRDPSYELKTSVVGIIGPTVIERDAVDRAGETPFDGVTASRVVELLNEPGAFGMRPMLPSPDDEENPNFVPRFQLYLEGPDEFASLAEPTWDEVGRLHAIDNPELLEALEWLRLPDDPE